MRRSFFISQENFDLLSKMIELAKKEEPVQGDFYFGLWNGPDISMEYNTVKPYGACGTTGCLAGGYLPMINPDRFYFFDRRNDPKSLQRKFCYSHGTFMDGDSQFQKGSLAIELGPLFDLMFVGVNGNGLDVDSTKEEVIANAERLLAQCKVR